ncbi:MAG: hypothetical protein U5N26_12475 [Candidatus Marinimicrobia bacterium]|nr:hypothetical protein [Candidatus Neomarinimicrobiota bacterium]
MTLGNAAAPNTISRVLGSKTGFTATIIAWQRRVPVTLIPSSYRIPAGRIPFSRSGSYGHDHIGICHNTGHGGGWNGAGDQNTWERNSPGFVMD